VWFKLLGLAAGGAVGALCRYGLTGLVQESTQSTFPWGTFAVNAIGCFLFGLLWTLMAERFAISGGIRLVVLTGFLGSFTTFSTFVFETEQFIESSQWLYAGLNAVAGLGLGVVAYLLGAFLGRLV